MIARLLVILIIGVLIGFALKKLNPPARKNSPPEKNGGNSSLKSCPVCGVYMPEGTPSPCGREDCPYK